MGCGEVKDRIAELTCEFEPQNEKQKEFCIRLKDELSKRKLQKSCKYVISARAGIPFDIKLKINNKMISIKKTFDESEDNEEQVNKTLELLLSHLGEVKEERKGE